MAAFGPSFNIVNSLNFRFGRRWIAFSRQIINRVCKSDVAGSLVYKSSISVSLSPARPPGVPHVAPVFRTLNIF